MKQRSDPAEWRTRRNNRPPSIARYPGHCDDCDTEWVINVTRVQRIKGKELCLACAGKE